VSIDPVVQVGSHGDPEARPDEVELKFGIKVSGGASWLVAKAAGEANFEVSLTWSRPVRQAGAAGSEH
jgi:hypothetical protein